MYKRFKLTLSKRVEIPVGAVVELPVKEIVSIPKTPLGENVKNYGTFHIRKKLAMKGLLQAVSAPFPDGYVGEATIIVYNKHVAPIELLESDEIGELWVFE